MPECLHMCKIFCNFAAKFEIYNIGEFAYFTTYG